VATLGSKEEICANVVQRTYKVLSKVGMVTGNTAWFYLITQENAGIKP
jgi:DNA-binding transcriptional regulator YhcF (GntR family)